jgi:lipid-A-disaccharide synthase
MKLTSFMIVAGEASGDLLAAELVNALRLELSREVPTPTPDHQPLHTGLAPRFFGAGGPHMAAAGVDLAFDLTAHSVTGLSDVLKNIFKFRRLLLRLQRLAIARQPDAIICVDFSGFNSRLAHAIRKHVPSRVDWFHAWQPVIVQYISPQVWASREGRVYRMAEDYNLVLSIFPFEKNWYARKVPKLPVQFIGHPLLDRHRAGEPESRCQARDIGASAQVLLLPGSRESELTRHLPVMLGALAAMRKDFPSLRAKIVLPNGHLAAHASPFGIPSGLEVQIGGLPDALRQADLAIASTGTVTMECAYFGVPTVALYKTSWSTFQIARHLVTVKYMAMPNLLADAPILPEFIQHEATSENIARAASDLLRDTARRQRVKARFSEIIGSLGAPGAAQRAAQQILELLKRHNPPPG